MDISCGSLSLCPPFIPAEIPEGISTCGLEGDAGAALEAGKEGGSEEEGGPIGMVGTSSDFFVSTRGSQRLPRSSARSFAMKRTRGRRDLFSPSA